MKKFLEILERKNIQYKKLKKDVIEIPVKRIWTDENNAESDDRFEITWFRNERNSMNDYSEFSLDNDHDQEITYCKDLQDLCYELFGLYELKDGKIEM